MSRSRLSRNFLALAFPFAPAMLYHNVRKHGILENALALEVHEPEVELGAGVTLLGVNEEPSYRCGIVAAHVRRDGFVKCLRRRDWDAPAAAAAPTAEYTPGTDTSANGSRLTYNGQRLCSAIT